MKYDKALMEKDIEAYGFYEPDDFESVGLSKKCLMLLKANISRYLLKEAY